MCMYRCLRSLVDVIYYFLDMSHMLTSLILGHYGPEVLLGLRLSLLLCPFVRRVKSWACVLHV